MKKARNGVTTPTEKEKNDAAIKAQKERNAAIQADYDKKKKEAMDKRKASLTIPASNPASAKAKEESRAREAAKNKAAVDAQKKRNAEIQARYDKRVDDANDKRRAAGLPAGKRRTVQEVKIESKPSKANKDYRLYSEREIDNYTPTSREPEKKRTPSKRKVVRTASAAVSAPKREMPGMTMSKPSTPGIQKGPEKRSYSANQTKIMEAIQKGKQSDGTMSASAQMKIKALKAKESAQKMKAAKKQVKVQKKSNRAAQKSTVKMSKK